MAFCSKCGAKLEDGAKFCGTCGAVQEAQEAVAPAQEAPKAEAPKVAKEAKPVDKNKMVGMIAFAVVAVVAIVLVVSVFSALFGGGYKKPLKTIKKAINSQTMDMEDYIKILPKFAGETYEDVLALVKDIDKDKAKELDDSIEEDLEAYYEGLENKYGKNVEVSYKVTDKEKLDKDDCEEIKEAYESIIESIEKTLGVDFTDKDDLEKIIDNIDEDALEDVSSKQLEKALKLVSGFASELEDMKISKGYILTVDVTVEGKDSDNTDEYDIFVVKVNGKWCIEPLSTNAEKKDIKLDKYANQIVNSIIYNYIYKYFLNLY